MPTETNSQELRQLALDHLWMHNRDWVQAAELGEPLVIAEGQGIRVKDADGKDWIDVNGGYASVAVGYGRTEIADAAYEQMQRITYFPQTTANEPTIRLAAKLAAITPGSLSRVFPVSGGSEANETALKIARAYHHRKGDHGRYKIISRKGSYHGATGGVVWLGTNPTSSRRDYEPAYPGMLYAPQPLMYHCEFGSWSTSECATRCAQAIEALIVENHPETVAAVIAEPVASGPGAAVPGDEYWPMLRDICDKYGVVLIADEIITGFGRTGKMFAVEHWDVVPDIMTIAKGMISSYLPIGATIARKEIAEPFGGEGNHLRHVFTFAGHPVSAAAALKNIEILENERLIDNAVNVGGYFKEKLGELFEKHPMIGDVRGIGLMLSIEFVADRESKAVFPEVVKLADRLNEKFKSQRLILQTFGHIVNFSPPLCIAVDDVDEIVSKVDRSLGEVERELGL